MIQATKYLAEGFEAQLEFGECASCDVLLYPAAVPIYIALGDFEQAERICRKTEETASSFGSRAWYAHTHYLKGVLATASQDWDQAHRLLTESLNIFEELEQPYDIATTLEHLADVVPHVEPSVCDDDPQEMLSRAKAIYTRLGATPGSERVDNKLAALAR